MSGSDLLKRAGVTLLVFEGLLGVAHLLWPEFRWGQGRSSYFNFDNSLTLASWLASMQLFGVTILALAGFHQCRGKRAGAGASGAWVWFTAALLAALLSFAEMTRIHHRFDLLGLPEPGLYEGFIVLFLSAVPLVLFGWFLLLRLRTIHGYSKYGVAWLAVWGLCLGLRGFSPVLSDQWWIWFSLVTGLSYLFGCTLLLMAVGGYVLGPASERPPMAATPQDPSVSLPTGRARVWILVGVGGITLVLIFLQIILFQLLLIFGDYLTANSVISIALLGMSLGGLIGFVTASKAPLESMIASSLMLPFAILLALGTCVMLVEEVSMLASLLLMAPFVCCGAVMTIALVRIDSHVAYFVALVGSGLGALMVSTALSNFREESSLLFLAAFTFLAAACFIRPYPVRLTRTWLGLLALFGALSMFLLGSLNLEHDWLNVVRVKLLESYPQGEVLFSRSSLVGRYDIVRRTPTQTSLSAYENGRITDTIRERTVEAYQIDPRIPRGLMEDPVILVLGLSGDGVTKTSRALGKKVYGVEINPAVVDLQTNELVERNGNSYQDIEVAIVDARSYLQQSDRKYDMITLLNTHRARGRTSGRSPSLEYLFTKEALHEYLNHLNDRGLVDVEEPVSRPRREPPVWKLLMTMRQVLLERGNPRPEQHFFVFQWRTASNNYIQILMKKTPFTEAEVAKLQQWLEDVDNIRQIESVQGRRMGPIRATTTILHIPGREFSTNVSRIVRGEVDEDFLRARNLEATTDDLPFHFDVDPARPEVKRAYGITLLMTLLVLACFWLIVGRKDSRLLQVLPLVLGVALTGLGYLLLEIVLIQRYEIFLGSPVATFASVLGTLLIFSGLGSLWSRRIGATGVYGSLAIVLGLLLMQQWVMPSFFSWAASFPGTAKIVLAVVSMAPLGFFLGVPFPFMLRSAKLQVAESAAATLFGLNAATSALAVPLALNLSMAWGLNATFQIGILIYGLVWLLMVGFSRAGVRPIANAASALALVLLLSAPWLLGRPGAVQATSSDTHQVYGLSYGSSSFDQDQVFSNGSSSRKVRFAWLFWVIQAEDRTILVDTGFDDSDEARDWDIRNYVRPADRLAQLGIAPSDVDDVVLTHAHWDHMGTLSSFANARVWIQEAEYLHARSLLSPRNPRRRGMQWDHLQALMRAESEGRLRLVQGREVLMPGITMTLAGGHTPGSQFVTVDTLDGLVVIAGDETYMYRNNQSRISIGSAHDHAANLAAIRKMQEVAASPFLILPGHDPRVLNFFPQVSEGIVHITTIPE